MIKKRMQEEKLSTCESSQQVFGKKEKFFHSFYMLFHKREMKPHESEEDSDEETLRMKMIREEVKRTSHARLFLHNRNTGKLSGGKE